MIQTLHYLAVVVGADFSREFVFSRHAMTLYPPVIPMGAQTDERFDRGIMIHLAGKGIPQGRNVPRGAFRGRTSVPCDVSFPPDGVLGATKMKKAPTRRIAVD
ncbi:hypothetical protein [Thioclava sp.]|uniref:hypothetical protein n=1 Tax=Thioclava sp. TaxID=1933450 RepID=UPI003AA7EFFD